ncbi:MAG: hypothetical protein SF028_08355 [Candidatus Sumerlaeia bacterium]|nr:hypothetical protein [Candidatus Sumerlaeia bacterium]
MRHALYSTAAASAAAILVAACARGPDPPAAPAPAAAVAAEMAPIENLLPVTDRIWSGGQPNGDDAFDRLAALGVSTIVSVDGAQPDVDAARARGMRYVHLPMGYDSVPGDVAASLRELLAEEPGTIFVHCHHGKHRGPAAAAVAKRLETGCAPEEAVAFLATAGTGKEYAGLWADVRDFDPAHLPPRGRPLVEVARVDDFITIMAQVDRTFDRVALCQKAGWNTPPGHPDVSPAHEALLLAEGLQESHRVTEGEYDADFHAGMERIRQAAWDLREALAAGETKRADDLFAAVKAECRVCHEGWRN